MSAALVTAFQEAAQVFLPPPTLTVDEWADKFRHLSSVDSAEQGQWRTERAPYLRGIMRAFNEPEIQGIVVKSGAQIGKTSVLGNVVGYFIHQDPSPIMVVQPTKEDAEDWSKDRFMAGMVEVTPCLKSIISDVKVKGETIVHKRFPGGQLTVAWSNSKSRLASRPIRILLMDEVNKYPTDPGPQGDPCLRAIKRTQTFWNRKWAKFSTPTLAEICEITKSYLDSDQRKYWVACPHCREFFVIDFFKNIKWDKNEKSLDPKYGKHHPDTAYCLCLNCGAVIPESEKADMVARGEWRAGRPGGNVAGFHISELYSTLGDSSWARIVRQFLDCKGKVIALQNFYNEVLGEAFELQGETVEKASLMGRRELYKAEVPLGVAVLTAAVDVQGDRLEVKVKGWGVGQESWDIHLEQIFGNPITAQPWAKLDEILSKMYRHESLIEIPIICTMVDSGGHHTQQVYNFCKTRMQRWIFPCKGRANVPGQALPIVSRPSEPQTGIKLWNIGVDTAKGLIYSRLRLTDVGPGYYHYPNGAQWDEEHFAQVTAEKFSVVYREYRPRLVWSKTRDRNEALDLEVYALAALEARRVDLVAAHANLLKSAAAEASVPEPEKVIVGAPPEPPARRQQPGRQIRGRSGFVNNW